MTMIPSEYLRSVNPALGDAFRAARRAIDAAGPLDYAAREYVMLACFAAAGFEESFRIHALRALNRGLPKAGVQQAALLPLGATTALLPVVEALRWIEDAAERQKTDPDASGTVRSSDGTTIGFARRGSGPPMVLVHGTSSERNRWAPVFPALGGRYTVCAMDRRGRGSSGDGAAHALEREIEDVVALVDAAGGLVDVVAHSYGAICALEAATRTRNIRRLVLYEPPIVTQDPSAEEDKAQEQFLAELQTTVDRGDHAAALDAFFHRNLGMSKGQTEALRSLPGWQARLALAPTLPRELRAVRRYRFEPDRFRGLAIPTLLILGGDSPPRHQRCAELLKSSLKESKLAVLAGHGHRAIDTAPALFGATVLDFLGANP